MSESRNGGAITGKSIGVKAESRAILGGTVNDSHGVWATGDHASNENYGVYCKAGGSGIRNFSLRAGDPGSGSQDWSGYFDGRVTIVSDLYHNTTLHFSDASLKTNVEDITGVRERLEGLRPRSYNFTDDAQMRMGSSTGLQFGLIAQEVEGVIPELVSGTTIASVVDTAGSVVWPDHEVKAVNYIGIIPLLVAGYQEQQRTIDALQEQLGQMQQTLAACCANPDGSRLQAPTNTTEPTLDGRGDDRKLRIVPNPFNESTTVYYTLERAGRTQLMANSADGRELRVLQEADLTTGDYEFQWNTAGLAPGMYYVTLLLDGQPVVKKAVKVDR